MNLNTSEWKEISLSSLFTIERGSRLTKENRFDGNIPLITAGFQNEGVSEYIQTEDNFLYSGEKITIDMFGNAFFRSYNFYCDDNILVLIPKTKMSKYVLLFITTIINLDSYRYSYGKQYRQKDCKKHLIKLPQDKNGLPDFDYMEKYIKTLKCKPITTEIEKRILPSIDYCKWKEFELSELFDISVSKDANLQNSNKGKTPYIASSAENNGVTNFIDAAPSQEANTMTIARNGSVGSIFYQSKPYCSSPDDIRILMPKFELNVYISLFLKTIIEKEKFKYAYGRKLGTKRIEKVKIKLPVIGDNPDWFFMEKYIKSLSFSDRL